MSAIAVSSTRHLRIAGITIAVRIVDDRVVWPADEAVNRFLVSPSPAGVEIDAGIFEHAPSGGALLFDSGGVWRLLRDGDALRIECRSEHFGAEPYKVATFDPTFTRGEVLLRADVASSGIGPLDYPLDELLIAHLLGRGRGVELHSCGVIDREGRGHLFAGFSGAGKTTTARLWGKRADAIVSDDRVIVRDDEGALRMYGTPWHGEAELSAPRDAPLTSLHLLVQSDHNAIVPIDPAIAVARLFGCAFPLFYDRTAVDYTIAFLQRITESVPVCELHFTLDGGGIDLVLAAASHRALPRGSQ